MATENFTTKPSALLMIGAGSGSRYGCRSARSERLMQLGGTGWVVCEMPQVFTRLREIQDETRGLVGLDRKMDVEL
ncbi:hypothetical protein CCHR01_03685 [Colletotrichum chrysophilum]|uniref:Uncharacterized protein n=1 Tax=Colletotrichum chrysophilum TaxID=1836956 RepID=A0AAD9ATB9_9PEZI|nr:hypothetical protein CCHR01_03685 [Colletotrichum chrysophilum]